ncbi:MAG: exopolysaccharide biosynthesis protein [Acidobacteriota bacterium]|nr:exopolysaccharide biosynthesis protein [Acidobacteriota bacterium]
MTDIHSHILWGMDDGAPTEEVSLEMLRIAAEAGTTDIVATPHSNGEFEYQRELIDERIGQLAEKTAGIPKIHRGCDLHLSYDNIVDALENPQRYSINGGRYVLVECSDLHISGAMDKILDHLLALDLVPIETHPERNPILRKEPAKLEAWVELGCLVQVTALSVLGGFGKKAEAAAHRLLKQGMAHVVASDAHDPVQRHPRLDQAFAAVTQQYGGEIANLLFTVNPAKIVRGEYVSSDKLPSLEARKWWQFWAG